MARLPVLTLGTCLAATVLIAGAAVKSTPADAKALLDKAVAEVQKAGEKQALAEFSDPKGPFQKGDLYVFCFGKDGKTTAHPKLALGTDINTLKDEDGKEFGKALTAAGQKGEGSVEYKWLNPATNKVESKISFVKKAGSQVCGVGAYK